MGTTADTTGDGAAMSRLAFVPLGPDTTDPTLFGGKAAGLGRLIEMGHRVPVGFAIAVDALGATIDHLGLGPVLSELNESMARGEPDLTRAERIRDALCANTMLEGPESALSNAAVELGTRALIARSSAAVEDSTVHSYAGMFESVRVSSTTELSHAIHLVWASAFAPRALLYSVASGMDRVPDMAVVVQRYGDAERSGVMFTTFTRPDGSKATLVEHVEGGSEKLVTGQVTPERVWLNYDGEEATALKTRHADQLARLAVRLEDQFGIPQDVEWCVFDDEIHVVQSRAITAGLDPDSSPGEALGPVLLVGVGASPGIGSGEVHLAFNIEQALALESGQVLVTTMTNPDMVVAMRNSVAVVTDVGGVICHAAIVSRELQLPCVVGTGNATEVLAGGQVITVNGSRGEVLDGAASSIGTPAEVAGPAIIWEKWISRRSDSAVPVVSTLGLAAAVPRSVAEIVYVVDGDIRSDQDGLWRVLGDDPFHALDSLLSNLALQIPPHLRVRVVTERAMDPRLLESALADTSLATPVAEASPSRVRPLGADLAVSEEARGSLVPVDVSIGRIMDPENNQGPPPVVRTAAMPDPASRKRWWALLEEYGAYHREFGTAHQSGIFPWIEIRSEVLTSPLLKSLVLPGFEMVPRVLGFDGMAPMHTKWFRTRFHVRADAFGKTWAQLVQATWDSEFMEDFLRRVRLSYARLEEAVGPFPRTSDEMRQLSADEMVALVAGWWPRWTEFFALCLFIQAQGEGILFPVISETVEANLADLGPPPDGTRWPSVTEMIAPTTSVLSGDYMVSLQRVRDALDRSGFETAGVATAAVESGEWPDLAAAINDHLREWHWMRDRDLLFEPWDTVDRVIDTALRTEPHPRVAYTENLDRNLLALSIHSDLASVSGRAVTLRHGVRFLQDLNVERENHHILWLKYSYPLRMLFLEIERRLVEAGVIAPGMVFFLQAPELMEALVTLPDEPAVDLAMMAQKRRTAYRHEAKLEEVDPTKLYTEDDYF